MVVDNEREDSAKRYRDPLICDILVAMREEHRTGMSLLAERERQQLAEWNATEQSYPRDACIPQLVAAQAVATPEAIALVMGEQVIRYRELNHRANQLAHFLQALGVGPQMLVGICLERSLDLVVGLLGILKAGGAYVPMDATYPAERLRFMLEDAQVPVLVTQHHIAERFVGYDIRIICLDCDAAVLNWQKTTNPASLSRLTDLAYVIYTSGSTGQPKGAQIAHDSLLNLVFWHQRAFVVTSSDRATQVASPAFDATGWELWPYLTIGASIYLSDEGTRVAPTLLRDWLVRCGITITFLPTTLAESVMALEWPSTTSLRFLLTGADTLYHYPSPTLPFVVVNNYGPTEATVVATSGRVPPIEHADMSPSIGHPVDNTQVYILNEHMQQVPIGEPGELYIGGVGLAKGYLNRSDLTAEKFVPNPFSDESGARLYKTGDLARYLPDGQIAFLGRSDYQIKIRGYRVELDEIMSVLNRHPSVQTSVVVAREDTPGDKRLLAYLVLIPGADITISSLHETLMRYLPDYMIPSAFVRLEALPLTANGKVNRAALPTPDVTNLLQDENVAAPSTPTEEQLARIIAHVLRVEQIGMDDNFFMLGAHSMLGTQVIAQVADAFEVDLPLRSLFEVPTVRQLSAEIERLMLAKVEAMSDDEVRQLLAQDYQP